MNRLTALFLILPAWTFAQETDKPLETPAPAKPVTVHFTADLSAATYYQDQLYTSPLYHGVDVRVGYLFHRNWRLNGQAFAALTDPSRNSWQNRPGDQEDAHYLRYSQCAVTGIRRLWSNEYGTKRAKARAIRRGYTKTTDWGLRFGYFYTQQSWFSDPDYYQYAGQPIYVTGYRAHAAAVGIDRIAVKTTEKSTSVHHFYADLLMGIHMSVASVYHDQNAEQSYHNYPLQEDYKRNIPGTRIGYEYKHYWKGRFGILAGTEFQMKPNVAYTPTPPVTYVRRGGEGLTPFALTAKAGITYRL